MNELLQKHGCSNVFSMPEGLKELMCDITREVLREQPENIFDFIANYLSALLITREHGVLAMKILEDLCDCKPSVSEHLMQLGMEKQQADELAQVIKEEIEAFDTSPGKEQVREVDIVKKILTRSVLDEEMTARVCQIARNAYRDYWYRKKLMEKSLKVEPDEPWEIAAQHTLELYKKTKPSFGELTRASVKIQAAYRGYYVRRNLLNHLKPKPQKKSPKKDTFGPPVDIAGSREIDLGPMIDIKVREDNVNAMFDEYAGEKLGLHYDPMKTITHVEDVAHLYDATAPRPSKMLGTGQGLPFSTKSLIEAKPRQNIDSRSRSRMSQDQTSQRSDARESVSRSRNSSITSAQSQARSFHKISFLQAPPEVIPDVFDDETVAETPELKELVELVEENEDDEGRSSEAVDENLGVIEEIEGPEIEPAQEVPEDLPADEATAEDEISAPTMSAPTSAPVTADDTDVDDTPLDTTAEDEGD